MTLPSNQNHREENQKCCLICIRLGEIKGCWNVNCPCHSIGSENSVIRKSPIAQNKSVTSEQGILEEFDKTFHYTREGIWRATVNVLDDNDKIIGSTDKAYMVSDHIKKFISASLRTHTREVLERMISGLRNLEGFNDELSLYQAIALLTEEIKKLQ